MWIHECLPLHSETIKPRQEQFNTVASDFSLVSHLAGCRKGKGEIKSNIYTTGIEWKPSLPEP